LDANDVEVEQRVAAFVIELRPSFLLVNGVALCGETCPPPIVTRMRMPCNNTTADWLCPPVETGVWQEKPAEAGWGRTDEFRRIPGMSQAFCGSGESFWPIPGMWAAAPAVLAG
jgi:hypothetical protein